VTADPTGNTRSGWVIINPDGTTTPQISERAPIDKLFDQSPVLAHIRQAAHSRMVSAPATLAYTIARALLELPPHVRLPPVIGSSAALNLGIAAVGESGDGKSATLDVSRELLGGQGQTQKPQGFLEKPIGSGEGIAQAFLEWDKEEKKNVVIEDPRAMIVVDEVAQMGQLTGRNGATLSPTLRTALTGGALGAANATAERNRHVPPGAYRLILVIGVQPTRAGVLLDDSDAGTPQRLVWVPTVDPTIPVTRPAWPGPLPWVHPRIKPGPDYGYHIEYPDRIKDEIVAARYAVVTGAEDADPLRGHQLLTRLKVATGLALLHGDISISEAHWEWAGVVVDASTQAQESCRARLAAEVAAQAERVSAAQAAGAVRSALRVAETMEDRQDRMVARFANNVARQVARHAVGEGDRLKHAPGKGCVKKCLSGVLARLDRDEHSAAIQLAVDDGQVQWQGDRLHPC
jgi:hypothetical protein